MRQKKPNNETSVVAKETFISGEMHFSGTLIVEGKLESQVKGADLTIQKTGQVKGTLKVRALNCHGSVEGDIHAENVVVFSTANISGEINASSLEVEPGATINGSINMQVQQTASIKPINDKVAQRNK